MSSLSREDNMHLRTKQAGEVRAMFDVSPGHDKRSEWKLEGRADSP